MTSSLAPTMCGVQLIGHGGLDQLVHRSDLALPTPATGEVLVEVTATAKNNTDRKAREGLYPTKDRRDTTSFAIGGSPTLTFPRIQGADIVGRIAACGAGVSARRLGQRGLVDFNIYASDRCDINLMPDYYGHGADGGFAEYVAVPADQFHEIDNPELADAELAALGMCSYQTAYHMLTSAHITAGERVLVTGASGGVGTALIQLCRIMGAVPYALSTADKTDALLALGAEHVFDRHEAGDFITAVRQATGGAPLDAVMDLVGGTATQRFIEAMTFDMRQRSTYPRLSIAGASEDNVSELLWTVIYLYQVQICGVSHGTRDEAEQLVTWIREGRLKPVLHGTFRLSDIHACERYFIDRAAGYLGKIVVVPDSQWAAHGAPFAITPDNVSMTFTDATSPS